MEIIEITIKFLRIEKTTPENWSCDASTLTWTWQPKQSPLPADEALLVYDINGITNKFQLDSEPGCKLSYQLIADGNLIHVTGNVPNR